MFDEAMSIWMTQMILNERRQAEMLMTIMAVASSSKLLTPEVRNELDQNLAQIRQQFQPPQPTAAAEPPEDVIAQQDEFEDVQFIF